MEPTDRRGAQRDELFTPVRQQPQGDRGVIEDHLVEAVGVQGGESDRHGVVAVGLLAVALREHPHSSSQLGGHVDHTLTVNNETRREGTARAVTPLHRPPALLPARREPHQVAVAVFGVGEPRPVDGRSPHWVEHRQRAAGLVRVDTDEHLVHCLPPPSLGGCETRRAAQLRAKQTSLEPLPAGWARTGSHSLREPTQRAAAGSRAIPPDPTPESD
jgi:hypothetical protein